jgi:hypothetical protein
MIAAQGSMGGRGRDRPALLVASRLAALGHSPEYFSRDAMDALVRGAAGSDQRLRAGLAGALFLAATEDAPRVDRLHVQRALEDAPDPPLPASRPLWLSPWASLPLYLAAALLFLLPRQHQRLAQPVTVEHSGGPGVAAPSVAQRPVAAPSGAAHPAAPPRVILLPEQLPPVISMVLGEETRQAAPELEALTASLRQAGLPPAILYALPESAPADPAVAYFYAEDRRLADRVARLLDTTPYPRQPAAAGPRLVARRADALPPPGSVEIRLP